MVTDLLTGLRERGLDTTRPIFVGIDGGKALRAAVVRVFDHPVIGRCQLHKIRNVADKLPDHLAATVDQADARRPTTPTPRSRPKRSSKRWPRNWTAPTPAPPRSLREGMAETLTVLRLGVSPTLARTLRSTNSIESMISIARDHSTQREELAERATWRCAGAPPGWSRPASSSAASTATCTCPHSAPRSMRMSPPKLSVPCVKMTP